MPNQKLAKVFFVLKRFILVVVIMFAATTAVFNIMDYTDPTVDPSTFTLWYLARILLLICITIVAAYLHIFTVQDYISKEDQDHLD